MFQTLKVLPAHVLGIEGELVGVLGFSAAALLWLLVPFLDRAPGPGNPVSRAFVILGWMALAYMSVMTIFVYLPAGK
jgi:quinol-cytochrome oxidoreductase complex cytochrome b subunit